MPAPAVPPTQDRTLDEYGRGIYSDNEIPPETEAFAQWRQRTCHPDAVATYPARHNTRGGVVCVGGWVQSGDWWLHCGVCRPNRRCGGTDHTPCGACASAAQT